MTKGSSWKLIAPVVPAGQNKRLQRDVRKSRRNCLGKLGHLVAESHVSSILFHGSHVSRAHPSHPLPSSPGMFTTIGEKYIRGKLFFSTKPILSTTPAVKRRPDQVTFIWSFTLTWTTKKGTLTTGWKEGKKKSRQEVICANETNWNKPFQIIIYIGEK